MKERERKKERRRKKKKNKGRLLFFHSPNFFDRKNRKHLFSALSLSLFKTPRDPLWTSFHESHGLASPVRREPKAIKGRSSAAATRKKSQFFEAKKLTFSSFSFSLSLSFSLSEERAMRTKPGVPKKRAVR